MTRRTLKPESNAQQNAEAVKHGLCELHVRTVEVWKLAHNRTQTTTAGESAFEVVTAIGKVLEMLEVAIAKSQTALMEVYG